MRTYVEFKGQDVLEYVQGYLNNDVVSKEQVEIFKEELNELKTMVMSKAIRYVVGRMSWDHWLDKVDWR
jgi:hypothetical protein